MNRRELRTRWLFAGLGLFSYGALLTLIVATEGETLTLSDFLIDAVTILLTVGAAVGVGLVAHRVQSQHEEKLTLTRDLESARSEGNGWRKMVQQHSASLRAGVDQQFEIWGMTDAEREIGLLILKGMSHKEIAAARETTDATGVSKPNPSTARPGSRARPPSWRILFFAELNHTDGDLGFHALIDGDPWLRLEIEGPEDRVLLAVSNQGRLGLQGLTELFFESAEPNFDDLSAAEFFARFPEGGYEIEGLALTGQSLESVSEFTHVMPAPPANITISGEEAPAECEEGAQISVSGQVVIRWDPVQNSHPFIGKADPNIEIAGYQILVESEESVPLIFSVDLPPSVTQLALPSGVFDLDDQLKLEILVRETSGNQTAVETCFVIDGV